MTIRGAFLGLALLGAGVVTNPLLVAAPQTYSSADRYYDIRQIVDRTQSDLQSARSFARPKGDQRSRFDNAARHLSTFDRHLLKGHFDKGEMDSAIEDVQHIIDKNTLSPEGRDAIMRDIQDLRAARSSH